MLKRIATVSIVVILAASGAAFAASMGTGTAVDLQLTRLGKVLATGKGRTLYLYTLDTRKSHCGSSCTPYWPPLLTTGMPVAGKGVNQSLLGRRRRSNGTLQVTYAGHPLYRYAGDSKPGETNGEGLQGHWFAVRPSGMKVARRLH